MLLSQRNICSGIEVVITSTTGNRVVVKSGTRVRIPPAPPKPFFFKSLHFNGVGSFSLQTRGLDAGELFAGLIVLF